jgi:hypothetical protein
VFEECGDQEEHADGNQEEWSPRIAECQTIRAETVVRSVHLPTLPHFSVVIESRSFFAVTSASAAWASDLAI